MTLSSMEDLAAAGLTKASRSSLARLLSSQPVPFRTFDFEGAGKRFCDQQGVAAKFAVRAISAHDRLSAHSAALAYLCGPMGHERSDLFTELGSEVLALEVKVQLVARCLVDPADASQSYCDVGEERSRPQWDRAATQVRASFDVDEIELLFRELNDYTTERSPISTAKSAEEVMSLVASVKAGQLSETGWRRFDASTQWQLLRALASQLSTLTRPQYLDTTSPENS